MNRLSHYFLSLMFLLVFIFSLQTLYMYTTKNYNITSKNNFIKVVGLPDLAISNEAHFVRHRSLSDTFSLFSNGPELLEYFPSTFTYNYSNNYENTHSRIEIEK